MKSLSGLSKKEYIKLFTKFITKKSAILFKEMTTAELLEQFKEHLKYKL